MDSATGLTSLLLGTTTVAVVEVTSLAALVAIADDGTVVVRVVEATPAEEAGYVVGDDSVLAVAGPTGTGTRPVLVPDEVDCEPSELKPKLE